MTIGPGSPTSAVPKWWWAAAANVVTAAGTVLAAFIAIRAASITRDTAAVVHSAQEQNVSGSVPVGTVIASFLDPAALARVSGDDTSFDPHTARWIPADGRAVSGSEFARVFGSNLPDLRGLFLRGLNYSEPSRQRDDAWADPDGGHRKSGEYQADQLQFHTHIDVGHTHDLGGLKRQSNAISIANLATGTLIEAANAATTTSNASANLGGPVDARGRPVSAGKESRPKNAAVFYYVRINK